MIRVKVCCIQNRAEMQMAVDAGVHAIGLVGKMPNGPGPISDDRILEISTVVPPGVSSFLLTSETMADAIIDQQRRTQTDTLQLVDYVLPDVYPALRTALPATRIVQVIHVTGEEDIDLAIGASQYADALLLDSGNPKAKIPTLGGTGNVHNWDISARIVREVGVPVFLAGGLNHSNVRRAIDRVQPYGVDACSGLRNDGLLDQQKLDLFMEEVYQSGR